ncbi:hypothetical protein QBC44DRAFT_380370 [Cladorrhinum sp. PSN332]|nr:hypothetical protein QBC44DRAFT_380370 [Cladorrhinum sp. PSN332]
MNRGGKVGHLPDLKGTCAATVPIGSGFFRQVQGEIPEDRGPGMESAYGPDGQTVERSGVFHHLPTWNLPVILFFFHFFFFFHSKRSVGSVKNRSNSSSKQQFIIYSQQPCRPRSRENLLSSEVSLYSL